VCKQAEKTLNMVMAGDSVEPVLRDLIVSAVEPNPDSSHLLVMSMKSYPRCCAPKAGYAQPSLRRLIANALL